MNPPALTFHFRNLETLRTLEGAAETLGMTTDELAEAAIEREVVAGGAGLEERFTRPLKRLGSYGPKKLDQDIMSFAQSEVDVEDPLQARRLAVAAICGIGAGGRPSGT